MDGPVVASYSVAESENDQEVFNDYLGIKIYKLCIHIYEFVGIHKYEVKWITVLCCGFLSISLNNISVQLSYYDK